MKYVLSTILFSMNPCSEATAWITHHMHFETFEEAVRACPNSDWLAWLTSELDNYGIESALFREVMRHRSIEERRAFFLKPEVMERLARGIIQYSRKDLPDAPTASNPEEA